MISFPGADQAFIDDITTRFKDDQANAEPATQASDVPIRYDLVTPEWFTAILCGDHPGAEVVACTLDKVDDGSSNRRRIFLEYNDAGKVAGLPETVFCKGSQELLNRVVYGILGTGGVESAFYQIMRPKLDIEAPRAYFANYDPDTYNSIILLHDMAGQADFCDYDTSITFERASGQMRLLARLHSTFYESPELDDMSKHFRTWPQHWANILRLGMQEYSSKGFLAAESVIPERLFERYDEIWPATMKAVEQHLTLPRMIIHGDVHLKNWYITKSGEMGLSDWQGPSIGHWSRDIAYAMCAALTVENRRAWENDLLRVYVDAMRGYGIDMPEMDVVQTYFRRQLFTALAYWTVTLRHPPTMPDMQPEDATVEFIKRIATAIDDHQALDSFD